MVYTQPPNLTHEEIETLLNEARTCIFCSLNKDGTIHAVPMRFTYDKGIIFMLTPEASKKVRNVKLSARAQ